MWSSLTNGAAKREAKTTISQRNRKTPISALLYDENREHRSYLYANLVSSMQLTELGSSRVIFSACLTDYAKHEQIVLVEEDNSH